MRFVTFSQGGEARLGAETEAGLVDLARVDPALPTDLKTLLEQGDGAVAKAREAAAKAPSSALVSGDVQYQLPIGNPGKILCIGLNYRDHAAEAKLDVPKYPVIFVRFPSSFVAHGQPLVRPLASTYFDYEAELVAVIGRKARNISKEEALDYVAGYTLANDGSIRDYQKKGVQWTVGKNFDDTGSLGPAFVTADELPAGASGLDILCRVNGEVLQHSNTGEMIFDVATLVYEAARVMTLEPGDMILTGTPPGVGFARKPPVYLKAGDTCEIEVQGIGILSNPVRDEA